MNQCRTKEKKIYFCSLSEEVDNKIDCKSVSSASIKTLCAEERGFVLSESNASYTGIHCIIHTQSMGVQCCVNAFVHMHTYRSTLDCQLFLRLDL